MRALSLLILVAILVAMTSLNQPHVSAQPVPGAHAEFYVSDFDNWTITWSLEVVVDGALKVNNNTGAFMEVQVSSSIVPIDAEYDRVINQTKLVASFIRTPMVVYGSFPNETWSLLVYFALNATIRWPLGCVTLQLPTQNYSGLYCVNLAKYNELLRSGYYSALNRYTNVYYLTAQIERSYGMKVFMMTTMVLIPKALWQLFYLLGLVIPLQVALLVYSWRRKTRTKNLLNTNYFAVAIGLLFFLPIYALSLRPYEIPVTPTPGDLTLFNLIQYVTVLLAIALPMSWLSSWFRRDSARASDTIHSNGIPRKVDRAISCTTMVAWICLIASILLLSKYFNRQTRTKSREPD